MNIIKRIISYILSFVLMIFILGILALNISSKTILNKQYVITKMEANNYYSKINNNIKSKFEEYIQQSGLDEEVLENLYTEQEVKKDIEIILNNMYNGTDEKIDIAKIKNKLRENINVYLKTTKLNSEQSSAIDEFINRIGEAYESEIIHTEYIKEASKIIIKINTYVEKIQKALIIGIVVLIAILAGINIKSISIAFSAIFIAILTTGILLIVPKLYMNTSININNIMIIDEAFSNLIRSIVLEILSTVTKYGITFIISSIILIIIVNIIKNMNNGKRA